jgi:hypothetical protein
MFECKKRKCMPLCCCCIYTASSLLHKALKEHITLLYELVRHRLCLRGITGWPRNIKPSTLNGTRWKRNSWISTDNLSLPYNKGSCQWNLSLYHDTHLQSRHNAFSTLPQHNLGGR